MLGDAEGLAEIFLRTACDPFRVLPNTVKALYNEHLMFSEAGDLGSGGFQPEGGE